MSQRRRAESRFWTEDEIMNENVNGGSRQRPGSPADPIGRDFSALLAGVRREVDRRLEAIWSTEIERLRTHGPDVVAMADAARDLTMRGGKRFRAALVVAAYAGVAPDAPLEHAYRAGVALELLQSYLLIQDDWMDGDTTRRGGPAAHATLEARMGNAHLGAACAVLASDFTWGLAIGALAGVELPAQRVLDAVRLLLRVHQDVVIGQELDVLGNAADVDVMHDLKTGSYTVRGPLALGATLAGADPATLHALQRYAMPLGVAFQLRDDLLGTFGAQAETGKPVGNDLRTGKRTALFAEAEARLDAHEREALKRAFGRAEATEAEVIAAADALTSCGARGAVAARLAGLCAEAQAIAAELPITPAARALLAGAAAALAPGVVTSTMVEPGTASAGAMRSAHP
jgi:geranylgeranyl diphosphate synthase type I